MRNGRSNRKKRRWFLRWRKVGFEVINRWIHWKRWWRRSRKRRHVTEESRTFQLTRIIRKTIGSTIRVRIWIRIRMVQFSRIQIMIWIWLKLKIVIVVRCIDLAVVLLRMISWWWWWCWRKLMVWRRRRWWWWWW
jgi:hypothetical protein